MCCSVCCSACCSECCSACCRACCNVLASATLLPPFTLEYEYKQLGGCPRHFSRTRHCNSLQHAATAQATPPDISHAQDTATHCNTLQQQLKGVALYSYSSVCVAAGVAACVAVCVAVCVSYVMHCVLQRVLQCVSLCEL